MTLAKYKQKRNFLQTPEPQGKVSRKNKHNLLYIIQKHAASHLHYDFRLELNGVLLSWAIPKGPCLDVAVKRLAMHVEDHPLEYGSFEGIIPQGQYGGGTVMLWDKGTWESDEKEDLFTQYKNGHLKFTLKGQKLQGKWKLIRLKKDDKAWLLIKGQDSYARTLSQYDITSKESTSILSGRSIDEIKANYESIWSEKKAKKVALPSLKKKAFSKKTLQLTIPQHIKTSTMPKLVSPQLATLLKRPPEGDDWLHEVKLDGYRLCALKENNVTRMMTRNHKDWTEAFASIAKEINNLNIKNVIFDGEIVVLNKDQKSDFQALQNSLSGETPQEYIYYVFDLLYYDKYLLTSLPLLTRKKLLQKIIKNQTRIIRFSDHVIGNGLEIFQKASDLALEGIISKNIHSPYQQKRTKDWLKVKCSRQQEFVIGGFTAAKGARAGFGALLLGAYNKQGILTYHGNVGTGFTDESLSSIYQKLKKSIVKKNPFNKAPPNLSAVTFVKPDLVAKITFTEWTNDGRLRHPSFIGLSHPKKATTVTAESSETHAEIKTTKKTCKVKALKKSGLTHPNKILYAEDKISKLQIHEYYEKVAPWILPYITYRPLTLVRCPDNYKTYFYQKHITPALPNSLHGVVIKESKAKSNCIYIKDAAGLLALPQLGVLELHPWGSRVEDYEHADMIIFDIDPSPEISWKKVCEAAFDIREQLAEFNLKCFVKTTGGKGLHVVIPIKPQHAWGEVKAFAQAFAQYLTLQYPKKYVSNMAKIKRKGKIFIDYLRNQRGATAIAPYSTRARIHAPVSVPIHWDELTHQMADTYYTIATLPQRLNDLKEDPWKMFLKTEQKLNLDKFK